MVAQFVAGLEPAVSKVRLEAYRPAGGDDLEMVVSYFLNIELSEALYPCLQAFEVALRNSIHGVLSRHFQSEFWFDRPNLLLTWQHDAIQGTRDELTKQAKPHEAGRIVAELNFGFWHSMLNRPYETGLWHANGATLLAAAFPHLPRPLRHGRSARPAGDGAEDQRASWHPVAGQQQRDRHIMGPGRRRLHRPGIACETSPFERPIYLGCRMMSISPGFSALSPYSDVCVSLLYGCGTTRICLSGKLRSNDSVIVALENDRASART